MRLELYHCYQSIRFFNFATDLSFLEFIFLQRHVIGFNFSFCFRFILNINKIRKNSSENGPFYTKYGIYDTSAKLFLNIFNDILHNLSIYLLD